MLMWTLKKRRENSLLRATGEERACHDNNGYSRFAFAGNAEMNTRRVFGLIAVLGCSSSACALDNRNLTPGGPGNDAGSDAKANPRTDAGTGGAAGWQDASMDVGNETIGSGGSAGAPGSCAEGSKRCEGATPQTCTEGDWHAASDGPCPFVCVNGACSGQCVPGTRQCSGKQPQRCSDSGVWQNDGAPCNSVCTAGVCTGTCTSGQTQCSSITQVQTCGADGVWGASSTCNYTCVGGSCGGICKPGDTQCPNGTQQQACGNDGQWQTATNCPYVCSGKICGGVCRPGATMCANGTQLQTCGSNGQWGTAVTCSSGACAGSTCSACAPGSKQCVNGQEQTCGSTGQWGNPSSCTYVCTAGVGCTTDSKNVFITSVAYTGGAIGGLAGADSKCQTLASNAGLGGTYKAWLSDGTGSPSTRFSKVGGPYILAKRAITVANNWTELTSGSIPLKHALDSTETGGTPPLTTPSTGPCGTDHQGHLFWSTSYDNGTLLYGDSRYGCGNWTDSSGQYASWGPTNNTVNSWSIQCISPGNAGTCAQSSPLLCIQQ